MKRCVSIAAALTLAAGTLPNFACAQGGVFARPGYNGTKPAVAMSAPTKTAPMTSMPSRSAPAQHYEELPTPARGMNSRVTSGPVEHYSGEGSYFPGAGDGYVGEGFGG